MYKVLIADDEYFIRYGLEQIIKWEEYGIEICGSVSNGLEALEVIIKEKPDLIITDVKMPEMNGLELLSEIKKRDIQTKVIVISGYNDFDYVKETLVYGVENYILKPIDEDELSETILNAIAKIETEKNQKPSKLKHQNYIIENVFNRLVTNSIAIREVEERMEIFDIQLESDTYVVALLKIVGGTNEQTAKDQRALISKLEAHIQGYRHHAFLDLSGNIVLLFCLDFDQPYSNIEDLINRIIDMMTREEQVNVFATIGSQEDGIGDIHHSYSKAVDLLEYMYIYDQNTKISYNKVSKLKKKLDDFFDMNIDQFKANLNAGNRFEVELFFAELMQNAMSSKGSSLNYIRSFLIELVAVLINIIKEKALWKDKEVIYPEKLYEKLFGETDLKTSVQWLKNIAIKITELIQEENNKPATMYDQVLDYIHENYNKDISLKVIAGEFYVNSSYLGQMFKKEAGQLFSTYLNEYRIEKAKILLKTTKMKASHIAKEVGYSDANYFYKVFKKYTGVYPSEYL